MKNTGVLNNPFLAQKENCASHATPELSAGAGSEAARDDLRCSVKIHVHVSSLSTGS